jgi:hypothetical protein
MSEELGEAVVVIPVQDRAGLAELEEAGSGFSPTRRSTVFDG